MLFQVCMLWYPQPNEWLAVAKSLRPLTFVYFIVCAHCIITMLTENTLNAHQKFHPEEKTEVIFESQIFDINSIEELLPHGTQPIIH